MFVRPVLERSPVANARRARDASRPPMRPILLLVSVSVCRVSLCFSKPATRLTSAAPRSVVFRAMVSSRIVMASERQKPMPLPRFSRSARPRFSDVRKPNFSPSSTTVRNDRFTRRTSHSEVQPVGPSWLLLMSSSLICLWDWSAVANGAMPSLPSAVSARLRVVS